VDQSGGNKCKVEQEVKEISFRGFYGNHHHTIDVKNRAFVPAKFKDGLASGFMLTKGIEHCLSGYPFDEWEKMTNKIKDIPFTDTAGREFIRFFSSNAESCDVDKQGRFSISQSLREYAQLTKEICFIGMMDHFEIWDSGKWRDESNRYDCNAEIQAEKMQKYIRSSGESDVAV
jgi:MraZ protein